MNLLRFFQREKPKASATVGPVPRPIVEKPASERFSKTFMPNAARVMQPTASQPMGGSRSRPVSLDGGLATGLGSTVEAPTRPGERTVALHLVELLAQIPSELLGSGEVDPYQRVIFSASELERGMANGRPAVLLRSIYQQAPTIFTREVPAEDTREIPLPFHKVLEQFANFQVRDDQEPDDAVPQLETPFLKVTLEDSEKFGTPAPALRSFATPAPPVVAKTPPPASMPTPVPRPAPAPVAPPKTEGSAPALRAPIRLSLPPEASAATPPMPAPAVLPNEPEQALAALPVTPKIFPNGAGVPITERVPASSGSSVPTHLPSPFAAVKSSSAPAPARIPFKVTPPASDLCPPGALPLRAASAPVAFSKAGPRVRLSLRNVLEGIPPFQLNGSIESVPAAAQIELPFSILEPQLSLGRVAISPAQFVAAMPAEHRALYRLDEGGVPVALPLREILENLPTESLQLRADQEEPEVAQVFETPFSQKAAEDAARFQTPAGPISKTPALATTAPSAPVAVAAAPAPLPATPEMPAPAPAAGSDAKAIVAELSKLEGVKACAIVFSDGLSLAANLPEEYEADALCAMAPEILKRINQQMNGANLGTLHHLTLFCEKAPVSFFAHENICLAVLHSTGEISPETRARLGRATIELARQYATPDAA